MTVCQFYLRGQCKFGTSCRNEHPAQRPGGFGNQTWGTQGSTGAGAPGATPTGPVTIPFTQEGIARDLTQGQEKPSWPLSSYGPAKGEPTILEGLDESAEEMRWKALQAVKSGNIAEYQKYETDKIQAANQVHANALANIAQVYKYAHDTSVAIQKKIPIPPKPVFGAQSQPTGQTSAFGKPSGFGAFASQPSAFGAAASPASAFGAPNNAQTSAFGTPSFGQSAFGQPSFGQSAFGQAANKPVSAFGQAAAAPSAFGGATAASAPSAFGAAAQPPQQTQSAFGQPSQPQSAFGKPSGFGAFANATGSTTAPSTSGGAFSAFANQGTSAFGSGASAPVFGQSAFGGGNTASTSNAPAATSAFGQPTAQSAFGASTTPSAPSAFGASTASTTSAFGQPPKPVSAFSALGSGSGAPGQSAFGQPSQPVSAFGQPTFGAPAAQPQSGFSAFGAQPTPSAFGSAAPSAKPIVGRPNFEAALASSRVQLGKDRYDELLPPNYMDLLPKPAKDAFESAKFEWGKIPEWIPPVQSR